MDIVRFEEELEKCVLLLQVHGIEARQASFDGGAAELHLEVSNAVVDCIEQGRSGEVPAMGRRRRLFRSEQHCRFRRHVMELEKKCIEIFNSVDT